VPRIHVVSDVHGNAEALARAGDADALVCLGDLISFLDYDDPSGGIMGQLFGPANVATFVELRTAGRFVDARDFSRGLWESLGEPRETVVHRAVCAQYSALFSAMDAVATAGTPVFLTYGNVDLPHLYGDFLTDLVTLVDGAVVEIAGLRWGLVGGGLVTPMRTPMEITDEDYDAKLAAIAADGPLDVVATHVPPDLPWLVYDTVAGRYERGSRGLVSLVLREQPPWSVFGHVHQPLAQETMLGSTRCANVGHFRATGRPYVMDL
jgi:Icc-related predicted phosphoesterase